MQSDMQSEHEEFDVVIVGGGPAGTVTGAVLAQRGHRVLILEKERFPRYHIGESLIVGLMSVLDELDLLDRIAELGFPQKKGISLVWGKDRQLWNIDFTEAEGAGYDYSYHVRRDEFDELLLRRAEELGAVVREETTVREHISEADRVVGVRYLSAGDADEHEVRARIVVDASGQSRVLVRRLAEVQWQEDLRNVAYWTYFSQTSELPRGQEQNVLVERVSNGWFWAIPVSLEPTTMSVGYVAPISEVNNTDGGLREMYEAGLRDAKELPKLLVGSERISEFRTTRDWSYLADRSAGPGWLAVGDSGGFIDPLFSGGVCLAILTAHPAALAVDAALRHPELEEGALAGYQQGQREMIESFMTYVRYFYAEDRDREDYYQQARSMLAMNDANPDSQRALATMIFGVSATRVMFPLPEADDVGAV